MSRRQIEKAFSPRAVGGTLGTRQGIEGIWVERDNAASFRNAMDCLIRFAIETGYAFRVGCTNAPSKVQAETTTYSAPGRIARQRRLISVARA